MAAIEQELKNVQEKTVNNILQKVTAYECSIPRMDVEMDEQLIYEKINGRWESMVEWFAGRDGQESEAGKVFDTTNEIIRKITRYVGSYQRNEQSGFQPQGRV